MVFRDNREAKRGLRKVFVYEVSSLAHLRILKERLEQGVNQNHVDKFLFQNMVIDENLIHARGLYEFYYRIMRATCMIIQRQYG